jgi:acetyl-CoA C-acetyltransferase
MTSPSISICARACASDDDGLPRAAYNGPSEPATCRKVPAKVSEAVYIIDAARTPFLKARGRPGPFSAADLATACGAQLLARQPFAPDALDQVILGCASPAADEANIARVAALRMGCGHKVPAWTAQRNCASGLQALDSACAELRLGRADLILAGGVDALSRTPLLFSDEFVHWLADWRKAGLAARLKLLRRLRLSSLEPVIGLERGLTDPVIGQLMGQTAETLASRFAITREEMDAWAQRSHVRAALGWEAGHFSEVVPLIAPDGTLYARDDGIRADSNIADLGRLKALFDRKYGNITAGNSSQVSDGAGWLLLASERAVERHGLQPLGRIVDCAWAALDPAVMGLGPVHAVAPLLARNGLTMSDIGLWELNEAFAAQVLACLRAWEDADYCREEFGLDCGGTAPASARINADGGAIALGHPVGASGARIVMHLLAAMRREGVARGVATLCVGGGQGGAMLIEALQ